VRRTFAGLLFGLAAASAAITVAGFLLQRTAFEPSSGSDTARVILGDPQIKDHLVVTIADAVSAQLLKTSPNDPNFTQKAVRARVRAVASTKPGAALLATIVRDAHARLIGERDTPVKITAKQLVDATQMQAAADVPTVTLDVPRIGILAAVDSIISWLVPLAGATYLVFILSVQTNYPDLLLAWIPLRQRFGIGTFINTVSIGLLANLGLYLIQKWYGSEEQGYYALALQWCSFAMVFTTSGVWIFWREIAHHNAAQDLRHTARTYEQFSALFFFLAAAGMLFVKK